MTPRQNGLVMVHELWVHDGWEREWYMENEQIKVIFQIRIVAYSMYGVRINVWSSIRITAVNSIKIKLNSYLTLSTKVNFR